MAILSADRKRLLRRVDFALIFSATAIVIYGLIIISSATHINTPHEERFWFVQRQGIFALVNAIIGIFFMNFDYRGLSQHGKKLYVFNLIMLVAVMLFGHAALGAQRWIQIGPISVQPSEFSKLLMIICMAAILEERMGKLNSLQEILPIAFYVGVPFLLVLKQPDLGTSLVFMAIFFGMVIACGMPWKYFVGIIFAGIASFPLLWQFMKDYQNTDGILQSEMTSNKLSDTFDSYLEKLDYFYANQLTYSFQKFFSEYCKRFESYYSKYGSVKEYNEIFCRHKSRIKWILKNYFDSLPQSLKRYGYKKWITGRADILYEFHRDRLSVKEEKGFIYSILWLIKNYNNTQHS